jgi:predicted CXXCH cytochrome family protein
VSDRRGRCRRDRTREHGHARAVVAWATALLVLAAGAYGFAQIRVASPLNKHNLSVTEICVFCHTPHNASPAVPLWNQTSSGATYTPYNSSTMVAAVGVPTGSSKLCLSCHDGTVALGKTLSRGQIAMQGVDAQGRMTGASVIGTALGDDHPVSFVPITGPQIVTPVVGSAVKLDQNGKVQCRSCHDPHRMDIDNTTMKFLVQNNSSSALCLVCHQKTFWASNPSTHRTSTKSYAGAQGAHTGYLTVATNGCESCHKPHTAAVAARSLKAQEEATCGTLAGGQCHGNTAVSRNIAAEFNKAYRHPTYSTTPSVHDASESPTNTTYRLPEASPAAPRHAECPDCHNPHASYAAAAAAPYGSGKIAGVWGIDSNGNLKQPDSATPSVREYEICYKCHAGSTNKPQSSGTPYPPYPTRVIAQFDMRLMFDPANPSYHPIEAAGKNSNSISLKAPWTSSSIMYCSDCHGNDQGPKAYPSVGSGPNGPHGSSYRHILVARYDMDLGTQSESEAAYALCYKCHDRTTNGKGVLADASFKDHRKHIVEENTPCSVCHDPHGVSATQGNSTNNSHLINFDRRFVTASSGGVLRFDDLGTFRGRCFLTCHGENHNGYSY